MNLHQILHEAWTFLHRNYPDDSEGRSYGQLVIGSFIMTMCPLMNHISCRGFWPKIKLPRWLSAPTAQIWRPATSGFSQNYNHFWKEEISDHQWDSGKYDRAAVGNWKNCVMSQGAYFEGDWGVTVLCTMFLVCYSINISIFHIICLDMFWTDLIFK